MRPFITNTPPVKSPEFVLPTSSEHLEFADIVSFAVADDIAQLAKEREGDGAPARPRIDLARFGIVHYQGFMENGDAISKSSVGYPWQDFYAGPRPGLISLAPHRAPNSATSMTVLDRQ